MAVLEHTKHHHYIGATSACPARCREPLSLLQTDSGSRIVEELLIENDEGMFVMVFWRISRHHDLRGRDRNREKCFPGSR
jgi:hypothetical protein